MALVTVQRSPTPSTTSSPCVSEADSGEEECRSQPRSISESFLTVKGAALFLPRGNGSSTPRISHRRNKHAGDLQQHLQAMFTLLRPEDNIRLRNVEMPFCATIQLMVKRNKSTVNVELFTSDDDGWNQSLMLLTWIRCCGRGVTGCSKSLEVRILCKEQVPIMY
ncbi:slingshot protein phosphatase 2 L homeolog [Xenopus laevis]|uniref:MGC154316 protein n=1 Tax=Xenopus laevis TaxID=8355 RepID=Q0IHJ4_XENLA|nr:slingshot protein phosphatase 2 L homeolog [Xenopus laevis]AAI23131.1 MGC154316 protein [Xenopus laevis]